MYPQLKKTVVHKLRNRFYDAKLNFVNSNLLGVHGVEKDTTLIQFSVQIDFNSVNIRTLRITGFPC
jgi:hypothetical protein